MSTPQAAVMNDAFSIPVRTLASSIRMHGIGLHTGAHIDLSIHPSAETGIVFIRADFPDVLIPARFDLVSDTRLCTMLGLDSHPISTIEHLMSAFAATGITNATVIVHGPELPIMDGNPLPFLKAIEKAGTTRLTGSVAPLNVRLPIRVSAGSSWMEMRPAATPSYSIVIDFADPAVGEQSFTYRPGLDSYAEIANARTFTMAQEVEALRKMGKALGGSLDNAVVFDSGRVLNPEGLRHSDEPVRHKMLDLIGDLALAGAPIVGEIVAYRPGHALTNRMLLEAFSQNALVPAFDGCSCLSRLGKA